MKRRITLGLAVACVLLAASNLSAAGGSDAMSPVGSWVTYGVPDPGSPGDPGTGMISFTRSGTTATSVWGDPWTNTVGSWEKVAQNRYRSTYYVMIPAAGGILRVIDEFWMVTKDEMEGLYQMWWVPGNDPLGEAVGPLFWGSTIYERIHPEPLQTP